MNDWLKNGFHADMKYLENPRRQEPATSIDLSYESVISCAINYNLFDISKNSLNAKNKNMAWIARYAVIDDYHKVLKRLIDNLMQEISKVYKLNYKVYIDTDSDKIIQECKKVGDLKQASHTRYRVSWYPEQEQEALEARIAALEGS